MPSSREKLAFALCFVLGFGIGYFVVKAIISSSHFPTSQPTHVPSRSPTYFPTSQPTHDPSRSPTEYPTISPTEYPTMSPTEPPAQPPTDPDHLPIKSQSHSSSYNSNDTKAKMALFLGISSMFLLYTCCRVLFTCSSQVIQSVRFRSDATIPNIDFQPIIDMASERLISLETIWNRMKDALQLNGPNQFAYSVKDYTSSICDNYPEATSLFTFCSVTIIISNFVFALVAGTDECDCKMHQIIVTLGIIGLFLGIQTLIYYKNNKCKHLIPNTLLFITLILGMNVFPVSCWIQSNIVYAADIIILAGLMQYMQFVKLYVDGGRIDIDEINYVFSNMNQDRKDSIIDDLWPKIVTLNPSTFGVYEKIAYFLMMMAVNYRFEVSIIIIYNSIICIFKILYDQCIECEDNYAEKWLRLMLILEFFALASIIQCKLILCNPYVRSCWRKFGKMLKSVLTISSLMHLTQTRTMQCWFKEYNVRITEICLIFLLVVILWDLKNIFTNSNQRYAVINPNRL